MRLLIFLQPLGRALKNQNAAPTTPPCFSRWLRSSSLLFKSSYPRLLLKRNCHVKQKRQWAVCLPVDIPTGWEPQAKQQPTGLIAYGAARRRPVQVLLSAVTAKEKLPCKTKKTWTVCLPVDIPTGWKPRAKQQPTGLIACDAMRRRPVQVLLSAVTAKGKLPCKTKKTAIKSCLPCGADKRT